MSFPFGPNTNALFVTPSPFREQGEHEFRNSGAPTIALMLCARQAAEIMLLPTSSSTWLADSITSEKYPVSAVSGKHTTFAPRLLAFAISILMRSAFASMQPSLGGDGKSWAAATTALVAKDRLLHTLKVCWTWRIDRKDFGVSTEL
jgi:hypothetical protein